MTIKEIKAAFYSALDNAFLDFIEKIYSPRAIAEEAAEEPAEEPTEEAAQKAETYGERLARALEILKGV